MMAADSTYPRGFNPVLRNCLPGSRERARPYSRMSEPAPVKYHFTDFSRSVRIPAEAKGAGRLALGTVGGDREVPELSNDIPYDPCKVDVFILGNVFRRRISDVSRICTNVEPSC